VSQQTNLSYEIVADAVVATITAQRPIDDIVGAVSIDTPLWGSDSEPGLDLDSLDLLEVFFELENVLGLTALDDKADIEAMATVGDLARAVFVANVAG
jgi:acyl carrier protein